MDTTVAAIVIQAEAHIVSGSAIFVQRSNETFQNVITAYSIRRAHGHIKTYDSECVKQSGLLIM